MSRDAKLDGLLVVVRYQRQASDRGRRSIHVDDAIDAERGVARHECQLGIVEAREMAEAPRRLQGLGERVLVEKPRGVLREPMIVGIVFDLGIESLEIRAGVVVELV